MTVHRDVDDLARRGLVRKYRGGVSAQPTSVFEAHSEYRRTVHRAEKARVADAALAMVEPGSSIMVDDSTTALALVERLEDVGPLTVVTNYLPALEILKTIPEVRLIALGGDYSRTHDSFGGIAAMESVTRMSVDAAFVSTSSMTGSMTYHQEQDIVLVKRAMLDAAARSRPADGLEQDPAACPAPAPAARRVRRPRGGRRGRRRAAAGDARARGGDGRSTLNGPSCL